MHVYFISKEQYFFQYYAKVTKRLWKFGHLLCNMKSPIRTYLVTALHEYQAIFRMLDVDSTNQVLSRHIRLCSITCHFLVDNVHFITYSNQII